jgi:Dolichyl-phosphate-mannose-protein mannosyltransferase
MAAAEPGSRVVRWVLAVLLALGTVAWALGHDDHHQRTIDLHADADYYYVYLPSLLLHGDLDFHDEYRETKNWYRLGPTPTGRPGNVFGIGPALYDAPLFLAGHAVARITGARRDGFSAWEIRLYTWSSLLWSLAAVLVAYRLARRRLGGGGRALIGPIAAACAGPVVYYAVRQPGYAHPMATFWAAWLVERWDASYDGDGPRPLRTWIALGALLGAAMLARPQCALWGLLLAAAALDDLGRRAALPGWPRRLPARWLAGAAVGFAVFLPQLLAWKVLYGHYWTVPQGPGFMRWDQPCWSETLFSSRNGLLPWAPAYAVFAIALIAGLRRAPRLAGALIAGVLLQALANGAAWDWWAGGSFGGRRFDSTYVSFAIGGQLAVGWILAAVPAALARGARVGVRIAGAAAALVAILLAALVAANLHLASTYTVTSARITGGEAAARVFRERVHGPDGRIAAWASSLANWPARAAFAWRHDTTLAAYDRDIGVHYLGDTYPGLNSYGDKKSDTIHYGNLTNPRFVGLAPGTHPGTARLVGERARILVTLNRTGGLELDLPIDGEGQATITWNGDVLFDGSIAPGAVLRLRADHLRRGANDLVIEAPAGTEIAPITVRARH